MEHASVRTQSSFAVQAVRAMSSSKQPDLDIVLHNAPGAYVSSFSSGDTIRGDAILAPSQDTRFEDIEITLKGYTKTWVDKMTASAAVSNRMSAHHVFLRLVQPVDTSAFPHPRIAEAGRTYKFPFTFVIPDQLVPGACTHACDNHQIHEAHLRLPPSLGDPTIAGDGVKLLDDLAPDMSKIVYGITARATFQRQRDGQIVTLCEKTKKIRVIPAVEEQPPVHVAEKQKDYIMRNEKVIKKGLFKGKLGCISVEAAQPKSLCLPAPGQQNPAPATTRATLVLRFDPASENAAPPRLDRLEAKLKVNTFHAVKPMRTTPSRENALFDINQGHYSETLPLSSRSFGDDWAKWDLHDPNEVVRRVSSYSFSSNASAPPPFPEPTSAYSGKLFYTYNLPVPITLPATTTHTFVPNFNSCLVSRVYQLDLSLSIRNAGSTLARTTLHLRLPLQISAARNTPLPLLVAPSTTAAAASELAEIFLPRPIAPPPAAFIGTFSLSSEPLQRDSPSPTLPPQQPQAHPLSLAAAADNNLPPDYADPGHVVRFRPADGLPAPVSVSVVPGCG